MQPVDDTQLAHRLVTDFCLTICLECIRFHLLKPDYVHHRIKELQRSFRLRLLVCHIDVEDVVEPLAQVIKAALLNEVTLICGWSPQVLSPTHQYVIA